MGVYIGLNILPELIRSEEWEEVFQETWQLLRAYPFITLRHEKIGNKSRITYSRNLEFDRDTNQHCWTVTGDAVSKKTGETFVMYRHLHHYGTTYSGKEPVDSRGGDIIKNLTDENLHTSVVFNDKTQGEHYHLYVLAIAMLVESRLPRAAIVRGNFTLQQAIMARDWANRYLERPLDLPVLVCPERLLARLSSFFSGKELINKFMSLHINHEETIPGVLIKFLGWHVLTEWLADSIKEYASLTRLGAKKIMIDWLNSTTDLATLLYVCCLQEKGPNIDVLEFTRELCATWVTIPEEKRFWMGSENPYQPETIDGQFGRFMLDLGFYGRHTRCYISCQQVVETIAGFFPDLRQQIAAVVDEETARVERLLPELEKFYVPLERSSANKPATADELMDAFLYYNETSSLSEEELYYPLFTAYNVWEMFNRALEEEPMAGQYRLVWNNPALLKSLIYEQSWNNRIGLTEDAWQWIDREENVRALQVVLALTAMRNNELYFVQLRRALLENRLLLVKVVKMAEKQLHAFTGQDIINQPG
ncbi:hypothetical protein [Desulfurispora thermophila]|uniref:hypothetical protein n=1 Tax=Desulfurispora thermophila TaxID=265470 RepID=UPI000361F8CF|nr:hypothetical protein [Desulfurispora thermophila]